MDNTKALYELIYPRVESTLKDPKGMNEFKKIVGSYLAKNAEKLASPGPTDQILFSDADKNSLFKLFGFAEKELVNIKKQSSIIKEGHTMNYGFNLLMPMVIRYISMNEPKMLDEVILYHALFIYMLLFNKYFPFSPVKNIMLYTVNNLSNKFKLKQEGVLSTNIRDTAKGAFQLHQKGIEKGLDKDAMQYVLAVRTRLNSVLKGIKREYEENRKNGKYLNLETESNEEESFREADATIYSVSRIVDKVADNMIVMGPNIKLITISSKVNVVSLNNLKSYIQHITHRKHIAEIKTMVESILILYMKDNENRLDTINSNHFLMTALEIYKRSNVQDKEVSNIKDILNTWMDTTDAVKKTNNVSTMNNFRRAIYTYFVLSIQYMNSR